MQAEIRELPVLGPAEAYVWPTYVRARFVHRSDSKALIVCNGVLGIGGRWLRAGKPEQVPSGLEVCPKCWPLVTGS